MSLHIWCCQRPCHPSSCTTFTLSSGAELGQSCRRQKSVSMCAGSLRSCPALCDLVDCGLPGLFVGVGVVGGGGRVLQARVLEHIGQYQLPYPSRALYFLLT